MQLFVKVKQGEKFMFKLKNKEFMVEYAEISMCFFDKECCESMGQSGENKLLCFIEIDMEEKWIDEAWWSPRIYHNNGITLEIDSWKKLENLTLKWDSEVNERGEEAGYLYVFEHEDVTSGQIQILERQGNKFKIRWTGKANVFWDEEYGEDVPFELETIADFAGITLTCYKLSDEEANSEIQKMINLDEFEMKTTDNGGKIYIPLI